jgi:hypothetical protein
MIKMTDKVDKIDNTDNTERRPNKKRKRLSIDEARAKEDYKPFLNRWERRNFSSCEDSDDDDLQCRQKMAKVKFTDPHYFGKVTQIRREEGGSTSPDYFEGDLNAVSFYHNKENIRVVVVDHSGETPRVELYNCKIPDGKTCYIEVRTLFRPGDVGRSTPYYIVVKIDQIQLLRVEFSVRNTPEEMVSLFLFLESIF